MIDLSPPGAWRAALNPEGAACAACSQNICAHSDLEYQGIVPAPETARKPTGQAIDAKPLQVRP